MSNELKEIVTTLNWENWEVIEAAQEDHGLWYLTIKKTEEPQEVAADDSNN